jgi:cell division protein FtsI/penicillin-binding protein 2
MKLRKQQSMHIERHWAGTVTMVFLLWSPIAMAQSSPSVALRRALQGTGASALLVDVSSGSVIGSYGTLDRPATPGSTLKPFVLQTALDSGTIRDSETIHCTGTLLIKGHDLACTHPRDITVLDARQALADSCNTYFAVLARRMSSAALIDGLRSYGLSPIGEATTPDDRALLALGLEDIQISPRQLAMAYRALALKMQKQPDSTAAVLSGLLQSVETGMAHAAQTSGFLLGGKTGTAPNEDNARDHGWFAGILFTRDGPKKIPARILMIYLPTGNGNDASLLARRFLLEYRRGAQ